MAITTLADKIREKAERVKAEEAGRPAPDPYREHPGMVTLEDIQKPPELMADLRSAKHAGKQAFFRRITPQRRGDCPNCGGTGALWFQYSVGPGLDVPSAKSTSTFAGGKWWPVENKGYACPACTSRESRIAYLLAASGLEPNERSWRLSYYSSMDGKGKAVAALGSTLADVPRPTGWMVLHGDYGRGKSGMLKAMVAACCAAMVPARYVRAEDILREIRSSFGDDKAPSEDDLLGRFAGMQLLAIDEIDRIGDTGWARATLFSLLDMRYNRRGVAATLLATNTDPDYLPASYGYLASRMQDGEMIQVGGKTLRGTEHA